MASRIRPFFGSTVAFRGVPCGRRAVPVPLLHFPPGSGILGISKIGSSFAGVAFFFFFFFPSVDCVPVCVLLV